MSFGKMLLEPASLASPVKTRERTRPNTGSSSGSSDRTPTTRRGQPRPCTDLRPPGQLEPVRGLRGQPAPLRLLLKWRRCPCRAWSTSDKTSGVPSDCRQMEGTIGPAFEVARAGSKTKPGIQ